LLGKGDQAIAADQQERADQRGAGALFAAGQRDTAQPEEDE
jgi:hypothetical protein